MCALVTGVQTCALPISSSSPSLSTSYAYDVLGRRTSASTNGVPITYSHDPAGQLVSEVVDGAERNYTYDESGRRTGAAASEVSTEGRRVGDEWGGELRSRRAPGY